MSTDPAFESLDYVYWAAPEFESSLAFYTGALGGELLWRIRDGETFELPQGPCLVLEDPGGQRLAVYERVRPEMDRRFLGRYDT